MATDTTQYLLSFNFDETVRQIAELSAAYELLTSEFSKQSERAAGNLQAIESKITTISNTLDSSMMKLNRFYNEFFIKLTKTDDAFKKIESSAKSLNITLQNLGGFDPNRAPTGGAPSGMGAVGFSFTAGGANDAELQHNLLMAETAARSAREAIELSKKAESGWTKTVKSVGSAIKDEFSGAFNKVKGLLGSFSAGAVGGGLLLSAVGLMVLGVQEKQRKGAERGEMANAFEGFGELYTKEGQRTVSSWGAFQEKAQWYWGVGRKEIQGVVNSIRNSGFKDAVDKNLGAPMKMAEKNAAALSIKLDTFLNQASGTAARQAIQMSETVGSSFETSTDKLIRLNMEAKTSGMDFEKFTQTVVEGSAAMMQYRVDVTEVAEILRKVKKHYEDMGMSSQQAGNLASSVTQGITGAVGGTRGFDEIFSMEYYAQKGINNLSGIEARQKMVEEFTNASEEESSGLAIQRAKYAANLAKQRTHGRSEAILLLRTLGYGGAGVAEAVYDRAESFDSEAGLPTADKELMGEFKKAFKTQGSMLTDLQKSQRDLINGLAKIGEGILAVASNLLAVIILGIRTLPGQLFSYATLLNPFASVEDKEKANTWLIDMNNKLNKHWGGVQSGFDTMSKGWGDVKKMIPGLEDTIDPFNAVSKAVTEDIGDTNWTNLLDRFKRRVEVVETSLFLMLDYFKANRQYLSDIRNGGKNEDGRSAEDVYNESLKQAEMDAAQGMRGAGLAKGAVIDVADLAKSSNQRKISIVSEDR